jgi:hypothetical protein
MRNSEPRSAPAPPSPEPLRAELFRAFLRHGYIRRPRRRRPASLYHLGAKEDWEVRFVLDNASQSASIRRLLTRSGFRPGPPFRQFGKLMQPLYGRRAVERVEALWEEFAQSRS